MPHSHSIPAQRLLSLDENVSRILLKLEHQDGILQTLLSRLPLSQPAACQPPLGYLSTVLSLDEASQVEKFVIQLTSKRASMTAPQGPRVGADFEHDDAFYTATPPPSMGGGDLPSEASSCPLLHWAPGLASIFDSGLLREELEHDAALVLQNFVRSKLTKSLSSDDARRDVDRVDIERLEGDVSSMPMPTPNGMSVPVWEALHEQPMFKDIRRNHMMTAEEKEKQLRKLVLPILGDPPGRAICVVEDPNGVYTVGATGAVLWPAAVALIERLDAIVPTSSANARVVELGAGLGTIGSYLCRHKGCHVTLTDVPEALPLLKRNVEANFEKDCGPEVQPFRWGDAGQLEVLTLCGSFDLVVGSHISYRPEHLDDLLDSAYRLLRPGGRFHLALQDRLGELDELDTLNEALKRSRLSILTCTEVPVPRSRTVEGTALENGTSRWCGEDIPDSVSSIFLLELHAEGNEQQCGDNKAASMHRDPAEVEAELFRPNGVQPASLSEEDEDVRAALAAVPEEDRPRSDQLKRRSAETFYAAASGLAESSKQLAPSNATGDGSGRNSEEDAIHAAKTNAAELVEGVAHARKCIDGLQWEVNIDKAAKHLTATVVFGQQAWESLQGSSLSGSSFRDAVSFELSDWELWVTYMNSAVLEVVLPESVKPSQAVAKLSSKNRHVNVTVPLCIRR